MIVSFIKRQKISNYNLPNKVDGSYWMVDETNKKIAINIEAINGEWVLKPSETSDFIKVPTILKEYQFLTLKDSLSEESFIIYATPDYDKTYTQYQIKQNGMITIGSENTNEIVVNNSLVESKHAKLTYMDSVWMIEDLNSKTGLYVNNNLIAKKTLATGDVVFIAGLKIVIAGALILINNPNNTVTVKPNIIEQVAAKDIEINEQDILNEENEVKLYRDEDLFLRSPRLRSNVERVSIGIDPPPEAEKQQETPMALTIGPMLTMAMTSMVTGGMAVNNLLNNKAKLEDIMPTLVISGAMLLTMIFWPLAAKSYEKGQKKKRERLRKRKYGEYIDSKKRDITATIDLQKNILLSNNVDLESCKNIILSRNENLWERKISEPDFLSVRIGLGIIDAELDISYPEKHFSMDEDNLRGKLDELVSLSNKIYDAPVCLPLTDKYVTAVVGEKRLADKFLDTIILQAMTLHSYEDLKIIVFTSEENAARWEFMKVLPHAWADNHYMRFFATNTNEMQQISTYLEEIYNARRYKNTSSELEENDMNYKYYSSYYLLITDDLKSARKIKIFKDIVEQKVNYGFSVVIKNDRVSNLPNECSMFIDLGETQSGLFESELTSKNQKTFNPDINQTINMVECATKLANIPIELSVNKSMLPNVVGFLEMYNVGKVEQLNILERWKQNNPVVSLKTPVGLDEAGELFNLDLHEKFHGPHGLIAGMTGSGKSEFIITYILSLAVNYHPDELTFVLIDYKGGGLAGAFENKNTGIKLPHLAGAITNLDTVEMKRSLVSIKSELKKRQRIFNKAREELNESTIDIYKYQRLYREGLVKEPVPHLFIISDEFAELKTQQPEFMEQLISTARIGRSLGVHLILATQKPSGVVDDQIWSNSKFRVCLKVQDKADSMDMIKCSDAAMLKNVGRFYLQVGYNEFFALGQSAWCGMKYIPVDKRKKKIDTAVEFIDDTGYVLKRVENRKKQEITTAKGEELTNVLNHLNDIATKNDIKVSKLWLDRIPDIIYVDDLSSKYSYRKANYVINPIIGEYDDPANQKQGLLTLNLTDEGNTVIYGASGSGKEVLLNSMIYSIIMNHSAEEVNLYMLDFGAETLRNFSEAPQVADVLLINDSEKISNLFKLLKETIEERKKLFVDFNGDYKFYCQRSGKKLPTIIVIINYYEAFSEVYADYEEQMLQLTREGLKYGIIFVVTVVGTSTIRYRLLQNFKQQLVLQLNDNADYSTVLGNTNGTYPSKAKGRGLFRMDEVYEFQTAYPYDKDMMSEYIKILSKKLKSQSKVFAPKIPILPEMVDYEFIKSSIKELNETPIGVEKEGLKTATHDFKNRYITLVSAQELSTTEKFVSSLANVITKINNTSVVILDAEAILNKDKVGNAIYYKDDFSNLITNLGKAIDNQTEVYKANNYNKDSLAQYKNIVCFIVGIEKFKAKLTPEVATNFDAILTKGKDLGKFSFIMVDAISKFKQYEYDDWFKTLVSPNNSIWIANGITEQFTIKLSKTPRELYEEIEVNFGYSIKNGVPTLVKLLEYSNK